MYILFISLVKLISTSGCTSDAPVSNRLVIERGVSESLNISTVVEHIRYHSQVFKQDV